jgi:hypothetical protein
VIKTIVTIIGAFSDLNIAYKTYNKISKTLSTITDAVVLDEQPGFRKGKCTVINIFIAQQIIEKRCDFNLETHNSFHHL